MSDYNLQKTPYLVLSGELWRVFCEYYKKNDRVLKSPFY